LILFLLAPEVITISLVGFYFPKSRKIVSKKSNFCQILSGSQVDVVPTIMGRLGGKTRRAHRLWHPENAFIFPSVP
jgi:hypothetical protein